MIHILTGSNAYRLKTELLALKQAFIQTYGEFGLEAVSAADVSYGKLQEVVQASPFLAEKRMVIMTDVASNKDLNTNMAEFLAMVGEETDLILVEPKFDKRSSAYKVLKKQANFNEYAELDEQGLVRWAVDNAAEQGGTITNADARYLVQRVGVDQLKLSHELAKLTAYAPHITKQTIDKITVATPRSTIFELLDAAFAGQKRRALQLYQDQRRQKVEPLEIIGLLAWQLHALALVKVAGERTDSEVASQAKINPFVVRKTRGLARNISLSTIKQLTKQVLELDIQLKSEQIDADAALQNLFIAIADN